MTRSRGQKKLPLITRVGDHACEVGAQRFEVRLHPRARAALGPEEPMRKLSETRTLALRPRDERLAEHAFPFSQRVPHVTIRRAQQSRGMPDRPAFQDRSEQLEKRILERGAILLAGLQRVTQVNAELPATGGRLGADRGWGHGSSGRRHRATVARAARHLEIHSH